jgi:hypothetical protein
VFEIGSNETLLFLDCGIPGCAACPGSVCVVVVVAPLALYFKGQRGLVHNMTCRTYKVVCKLDGLGVCRGILKVDHDELFVLVGGK